MLIETMQQATISAYRFKIVRRTPKFTYWTIELKTKRKRLREMRRKLKRHRKHENIHRQTIHSTWNHNRRATKCRIKTNNIQHLTSQKFRTTAQPNNNIKDLTFDTPPDNFFTKSLIRAALYTFNDKKTPGPDSIDFRLFISVFIIILISSHNELIPVSSITILESFWEKGKWYTSWSKRKSLSEPNSYRTINLLPMLG